MMSESSCLASLNGNYARSERRLFADSDGSSGGVAGQNAEQHAYPEDNDRAL